MKKLFTLSAVAAVLMASATVASADTVQLVSYGTNINGTGYVNPVNTPSPTGTSSVNTAFVFTSAPVPVTSSTDVVSTVPGTWANPLPGSIYVSYGSGYAPGSVAPFPPNSTTTPYVFTSTFNLSAAALAGAPTGSFYIYTDDAVVITLNGITILSQPIVPDFANFQTGTLVNISTADLVAGLNTLVINDYQLNSADLGFDLAGSVSSVPEPNTLLMLGTGLMGSAGALLRRMRS